MAWTRRAFDLQAHRGGLGLTVENTLAAFGRALDLGVTTLELDVQLTQDGHAIVVHDQDLTVRTCVDTAPAFPGDPEWPYVPNVRYVADLTLAQLRTLDCGSTTLPGFPDQLTSPGAQLPLLTDVFALVQERQADEVGLNVELKIDPRTPAASAPTERVVDVVTRDIRDAGMLGRVSVQSFDWGALMLVRELQPGVPIVALSSGPVTLEPGVPGPSPWLGGIDVDDVGGDLVSAARSFAPEAISPAHGFPVDGGIGDPGYEPYTTAAMVAAAHDAGMGVVPWTVDDPVTMQHLLDVGVDGIITNRPDLLRTVLARNGLPLPRAYPAG